MKSIEASLEINFGDLVDNMGKLAWTCILNQFITVLVGSSQCSCNRTTTST